MKYDYWFGPDEEDRREKYVESITAEIQQNGDAVQGVIATVEHVFVSETGIQLPYGYASGWRPPSVNEATANAGKRSTHLTAQAGDKRDSVDGSFAWWCLRNIYVLERHSVWMEHPVATVVRAWRKALEQGRDPTPWCHLQTVPPKSANRVYFPDTSSISEWEAFTAMGGYAGMTYEAWRGLQPQQDSLSSGKTRKAPGKV